MVSLSEWLTLREPADVTARSATMTQALAATLPRGGRLQVLELGTGTGSNIRYLADRLHPPQDWLALDNDVDLLAEIPTRLAAWTGGTDPRLRIETRRIDLGGMDYPDLFF